jgi:DNA-binding transcriptional ArsR family regulator
LPSFAPESIIFGIMNPTNPAQPAVSAPTMIPLATFLPALASPVRWEILKHLSAGEPLPVSEIAQLIGRSTDLTSKHLAVLRRAGLVMTGRGHLYSIPKMYQPVPGQRVADFGHCLLRLDAGA